MSNEPQYASRDSDDTVQMLMALITIEETLGTMPVLVAQRMEPEELRPEWFEAGMPGEAAIARLQQSGWYLHQGTMQAALWSTTSEERFWFARASSDSAAG